MERTITRITIAAATRQRPRMLSDLLQSLQALDVPQGAELSFIFVENDTVLTIADLVEEFHKRTGWPAIAIHEPKQGISHARNAVLEAALAGGSDWLAFVDDDEQVRHDWLRLLWAGAKEANAKLAGGPVLPVAPSMGCSDDENAVLAYYERASAVSNMRKVMAMEKGLRFDVGTGNWLANLEAVSAAGLRFDPEFGLSGGEDTNFSREAYKAGLTLAWVPHAIATEEVSKERLSASYIAERARAQSITKFQIMTTERPRFAKFNAVVQILAKGIGGFFRVTFWPILGHYSYYRGIRSFGIAQGFFAGLRGEGQARYTHIIGD